MRGKHMHMDMSSIAARIIPAHAGQTAPVCNPNRPPPDHPRACGANEVIYERLSQLIGSSPRMRGKPITPVVTPKQQRIIPAHAGQTMACTPFMPKRSDHPRACGANRPGNRTTATRCGSSPRMRGKPDFLRVPLDTLRIIPAHAGQTNHPRGDAKATADHPRACGANCCVFSSRLLCSGSSPRMRGKPVGKRHLTTLRRIIPAHAGQTQSDCQNGDTQPDHPRACGANCCVFSSRLLRSGSSPRMRGKRTGNRPTIHLLRIIPAHAGQTSCSPSSKCVNADHPRACGANSWTFGSRSSMYGSSPRMRGKLHARIISACRIRIIPAHAGQTVGCK